MNREIRKTCLGYTATCDGPVAHAEIILDGGLLLAPVKVIVNPAGTRALPKPKVWLGELVYALPGGEEYVRP